MTRTEDEHELVLGNKQLLSAFFVVAILLGVFFTMGYFVGKNTATAGFNSGTAPSSGGSRPDAVGKPLDSASPSASQPAPDSTTPAADDNGSASTVPAAVTMDAKPAPVSETASVRESTRSSESSAVVETGGEQMYLQVFALRRSDAAQQVKVLREGGFPALVGESSKPGIYRVLVGPFKSTGEMGHTKAALKAKGFDSIVAK